MEFVIITGMSGAGKSTAANLLEDIGFYCIDNIPPALICDFAKLLKRSNSDLSKIAIVTDTRGSKSMAEIDRMISELKDFGIPFKILFLDASDECLIHRYKETRRSHPLGDEIPIPEAIKKEREIMQGARSNADFIVDTSFIKSSALKKRITGIFSTDINSSMPIQCMSFGFKYGSPMEADIVFDARCLPNPFYVPELKNHTGLEQAVVDYVMNSENSKGFVKRMLDFVDYSVPLYRDEGKSNLVIAVGCTGGKHRSVALTQMIYKNLFDAGYQVSVYHRDIYK